jgi:hypothetical protein
MEILNIFMIPIHCRKQCVLGMVASGNTQKRPTVNRVGLSRSYHSPKRYADCTNVVGAFDEDTGKADAAGKVVKP